MVSAVPGSSAEAFSASEAEFPVCIPDASAGANPNLTVAAFMELAARTVSKSENT